ncbi:MAG: hypothetical protein CM15mP115_10270 [Alphaproteobacteria bacterium]|nr:MAG: hypothetical protein CM15mP115_10270 [Alphaproteobacteria bacterium]
MVVFGVGAMDVERQWPPSHFARLAAAIRAEWPGLRIVLTGAPSEASIVQAVMSDEAAPAGLIEKSGPLDEAVALIGRARLYRQRHQPAEHRCRLRPAGHRVFCANRAVGL